MIVSGIRRLQSLKERRRRARRFSIAYSRDKDWTPPESLLVHGKKAKLFLPADSGTAIAFKDIFLSDVYGLESLFPPPTRILDVGAHVGLFSLAVRILYPQSIAHAYEPNPILWSSLDQHSKAAGFTVFHEAVGRTSGAAVLESAGDTVFTRCLPVDGGDVRVVGIRQAVQRLAEGRMLDLLKLDCEGEEWSILQDRAAMQSVQRLTMEYHLDEAHSLKTLIELLQAVGFQINFVHEDGILNGRVWAERRTK